MLRCHQVNSKANSKPSSSIEPRTPAEPAPVPAATQKKRKATTNNQNKGTTKKAKKAALPAPQNQTLPAKKIVVVKKGAADKLPDAPATPQAGKKNPNLEDLRPGESSPNRNLKGLYIKGCDHDNLGGLICYERPYFTAKELKKENYPQICAGCKKSLLPGKDPEKFCTISGVAMVRCCKNAMSHREHKCQHVLCNECFLKAREKAGPEKERQEREDSRQSRRKRR